MSGTLAQADFIYQSSAGGETYQYTITYDANGVYVRDIQNGYGLIVDSYSRLPSAIATDITNSITQVEDIVTMTSAVNGTLTFSSETSKSVLFSTPMAGTTYRVQLSCDIFVPLRITNKLVTGFTVDAGAEFSGTVGYDVFA